MAGQLSENESSLRLPVVPELRSGAACPLPRWREVVAVALEAQQALVGDAHQRLEVLAVLGEDRQADRRARGAARASPGR